MQRTRPILLLPFSRLGATLPAVAAAHRRSRCASRVPARAAVTTPRATAPARPADTKKTLAAQADLDAAKARSPRSRRRSQDVTRQTVHNQPTLRISGVNVQIVNGSGGTAVAHRPREPHHRLRESGRGDRLAQPHRRQAAHGRGTGSIIGGLANTSDGPGQLIVCSATATARRTPPRRSWAATAASPRPNLSSILGGCVNATGLVAAPECLSATTRPRCRPWRGGTHNVATGAESAVAGGNDNTTSGLQSADPRRVGNDASGETATVAGGVCERRDGPESHVSGGAQNTARRGAETSILGGEVNNVIGLASAIVGGDHNDVELGRASILGGVGEGA